MWRGIPSHRHQHARPVTHRQPLDDATTNARQCGVGYILGYDWPTTIRIHLHLRFFAHLFDSCRGTFRASAEIHREGGGCRARAKNQGANMKWLLVAIVLNTPVRTDLIFNSLSDCLAAESQMRKEWSETYSQSKKSGATSEALGLLSSQMTKGTCIPSK